MQSLSLRTIVVALLFTAMATTAMSQSSPESLDDKRERKKNLTIREYNTDAKGKNMWMDHITVYNAKGFKIEEIEYATYGMRQRITYSYDAKDFCIKEVVYDDRNKVTRIRKYEYNADGTKKIQYNYLPNGRLYSTKQYKYNTN